jgi:chromosome segregation ATPase
MLSRSSTSLLDQSPIIAEVLRQISVSKSTVQDLRTQLAEFRSAASQSHAGLQSEVDSYRERRRQEDASRLDLKSRTKTLEDSKRHAEGHKRDAEKRLKAAQTAHDDCTQRMEHFNSEIARLQQRSVDDEAAMEQSKVDTVKAEQEISEALELKSRRSRLQRKSSPLLTCAPKSWRKTWRVRRRGCVRQGNAPKFANKIARSTRFMLPILILALGHQLHTVLVRPLTVNTRTLSLTTTRI